ncbi:MAG: hypothetical protein WC043_06100 [Pseudobdellovibrionaceae bacterium]
MVRKIGLVMMGALLMCTAGYSTSAVADSGVEDTPLMNLFPTQRTAHQQQIEATGFAYHDRGAAYVANLYDNHAEKDLEEDNSLLFLESSEVQPKPVDIEEVASIIKDGEKSAAAK